MYLLNWKFPWQYKQICPTNPCPVSMFILVCSDWTKINTKPLMSKNPPQWTIVLWRHYLNISQCLQSDYSIMNNVIWLACCILRWCWIAEWLCNPTKFNGKGKCRWLVALQWYLRERVDIRAYCMNHDYGIVPKLDKAVILGAAMCPAGLGNSTKVPALLFCAQYPATSKRTKCLICSQPCLSLKRTSACQCVIELSPEHGMRPRQLVKRNTSSKWAYVVNNECNIPRTM